jgi:ubiquitin-protein ligase
MCSFCSHLCPPACSVVFAAFAGEICLDILKDAWTPIWTLESTCRAIIFLLGSPAPDSPLNCDAGNLLRAGMQHRTARASVTAD